jgi:hypothetical protein
MSLIYNFSSQGLDVQQVYIRSLLAALCFHAYQQVSFLLLCTNVSSIIKECYDFHFSKWKLFHSKTISTHWKQKSNYLQVAYMILQRVSPVTHSVANCLKRVIVIVSSVIFFQTPVSPINALGNKVASFLLFNHISLHNSCWNWTFYVPIILRRNWYSYFWCFPIFQGKPN